MGIRRNDSKGIKMFAICISSIENNSSTVSQIER